MDSEIQSSNQGEDRMNETERDGWPLTLTRSMEDFPVANVPLKQWHAEHGSELAGKIAGCRFPWDLLAVNEIIVGDITEDFIEGDVHPLAVIEGRIRLGAGSRILPGVFIEGNVVIGRNCRIGPNCYIRGNTSIGDGCIIGQSVEIKNCIILSGTSIGHLSYVGDSILGEKVNFGAGTIVSNFRHDSGNHRSMVEGELVDTGRWKFGTIVGDGVHTGIGTLIYPGRKIWPNMNTRPGEVVERDLRP